MKKIRKINRQKWLRPDTLPNERHAEVEEIRDTEVVQADNLCGTWESVNLNPSLIVCRDRGRYQMIVIHIAESGQAAPSTYEIEYGDGVRFVRISGRRAEITYDPLCDELSLAGYGTYMRN